MCLYRSDKGLKCAAGCLIADWEYDEKYENESYGSVLILNTTLPHNHRKLITSLQNIHDTSLPISWVKELNALTKRFEIKL